MESRSRRRSRPSRSRKRATRSRQHTSLPTSRTAYADTRVWLLEQHGPVCAYCGRTVQPRSITLDHVTPRKGQSAYDRRDNLVLACKRCNTAKADRPFLAFVLGNRTRATNLFRYGSHLSQGILDMLQPLVGELPPVPAHPPHAAYSAAAASNGAAARPKRERIKFGSEDGESPYADESPYRKTA